MSVESATYISDLNSANPGATDLKAEGDDHLRLLKTTIKATFPNVTGAVTPTHTVINNVTNGTFATKALTGVTDITTSGNIGAGTTPTFRLHVVSAVGNIASFSDGIRDYVIKASAGMTTVGPTTSDALGFQNAGTLRGQFDASGHFGPATNNTYTCGTAALRWSTVNGVLGNFSGLVTASAGVNFGGTTLATYTEGTFTPAATFGGAAVGMTLSAQTGTYTRVGDTVHCQILLSFSNKGSSTGNFLITGLPFTAKTSAPNTPGVIVPTQLNSAPAGIVTALALANSTTMGVYDTAVTGSSTQFTHLNIGNSTSFSISVTYKI